MHCLCGSSYLTSPNSLLLLTPHPVVFNPNHLSLGHRALILGVPTKVIIVKLNSIDLTRALVLT